MKAGTVVIQQGDPHGDKFYVVEKGVYSIVVSGKQVQTYDGKKYPPANFGELALLYNQPRSATVKAETDGILWALDRLAFTKYMVGNSNDMRENFVTFLRKNPLLGKLDSEELETIQSWAKEEFRKIREMKQIEVDTMRRLVDKLNWQQIALKTLPRYTGNQCYLHYVNNEVPWRVKRFGKIETAKLKAAVAKHGTRGKWIEIAKEVHKDATPFQCLQEHMRFVKATRSRLPWTKEEDDVLRESVKMFGTVCSSVVFEREAREFNFHYSITQIT